MFLKSLTITSGSGALIRQIIFRLGFNLIIDETPSKSGTTTGNNVGKTTVLKLVDFCLNGSAKGIYSDTENHRNEHKIVKDFLLREKVIVCLVLKDDLSAENSREVSIERNFLSRTEKIQRIDGKNLSDEEFERVLTQKLIPGHYPKKPTLRQIITHNIRYKDSSLNNTIKHLDRYTRDDEYETLYLYLLGCDFENGDTKQILRSQIKAEEQFKARLESEQTKSAYEAALAIVNSEINEFEKQKEKLNLDPEYEANLDNLNGIKYEINVTATEINRYEIRKKLIEDAQKEMQSGASSIDGQQLWQLYSQAQSLVAEVQRSFEELSEFHNKMIESKVRFITQELPSIERILSAKRKHFGQLSVHESQLRRAITQSESFEGLQQLITELNLRFQKKGEYESVLKQLNEVESKLAGFNKQLAAIDDDLFSDEFAYKIKGQVDKFNRHFSSISNALYGEKYALKFDKKMWRERPLYEFSTFNLNFSSGKKQGEISCFDIAYIRFADEEGIPCLHFLLNDKKELMHGNQLLAIANLVNEQGIQYVASILKDKLPTELNKPENVILTLSQQEKLFRIENG